MEDAPLRVTFDGSSSSDPDGTIDNYEWVFDDGETLLGIQTERTFDRSGEYSFFLRVTDSSGLMDQTESFIISVTEFNAPPVMVGDQNFELNENMTLEFDLSGATDADSDTITYEIVNAPSSGYLSNCLNGTQNLSCTYTSESDFVGTVLFSYKANDGQRDSETVSLVTLNIVQL